MFTIVLVKLNEGRLFVRFQFSKNFNCTYLMQFYHTLQLWRRSAIDVAPTQSAWGCTRFATALPSWISPETSHMKIAFVVIELWESEVSQIRKNPTNSFFQIFSHQAWILKNHLFSKSLLSLQNLAIALSCEVSIASNDTVGMGFSAALSADSSLLWNSNCSVLYSDFKSSFLLTELLQIAMFDYLFPAVSADLLTMNFMDASYLNL